MLSRKKIARLDTCKFTELPSTSWFDNDYNAISSALSIDGGEKGINIRHFFESIMFLALICFESHINKYGDPSCKSQKCCEIFNGVDSSPTFRSLQGHYLGALALYNGQPTATGGKNYPNTNGGFTETLTDDGWIEIPKHTK